MKTLSLVNRAIKILIFGNVAVNMADGFFAPVFAIFVTQKIAAGDVSVVGYAIAIYWLTKSLIQIPIARYLDRTDGESDDYKAILIGGACYVLLPLTYIFIQSVLQLYLIQFLFAIAASFYVVPWASLFTRHVDKFRIGFEWSLNSSAIGLGLMAASAIGGYVAQNFGFNIVFIISALFNLVGFIVFLFLKKNITQTEKIEKVFPEQNHHRYTR